MLSSTFTDLKEHRQKAIEAIHAQDFKANVMEHDVARADAHVIDASLKLVGQAAAFICVISRKYGQTPFDPARNPDRLSITELEFNEALKLRRPILLFIMGEKHPVTEADVELDPDKRTKLNAFRERAKRWADGSEVERVYKEFESLNQFAAEVAKAVGRLAQHLASDNEREPKPPFGDESDAALPRPPKLAALPKYLGSHDFVGRDDELRTLNEWCGEADPNPMLLFEAMGGSGKSMLTWKWVNEEALTARGDWAGRFWFSFYEKGALMAGFCRHALAYMTGKPLEGFAKLRTPQLADLLVAELDRRSWLLVLDGLERVLVAYQRADAAQLADDEVDQARDPIEKRDPCTAIRPEDDDLLRRLAAVIKSKILVTSRLTPHALVNRSGMPVPGVRREFLKGLRPGDAEKMMIRCGIRGDSNAIQRYLQSNCDCHPLVIGALAGLINTYPPDPANFDRWVDDPRHGRALNLGELDLRQRKTHILEAAIDALQPESRQLLQTLSLLQAGADYEMLKAFNPHLPPEPEKEKSEYWNYFNADERAPLKAQYAEEQAKYQAYLDAITAWKNNPAVLAAPAKLEATIHDLQKRGLLQFDQHDRRYDLHPVVRGVTVGGMRGEETQRLGRKVVDHFNSRPHDPWERAETLADIEPGLEIVRVMLRMERYGEALDVYRGPLGVALIFNLDARAEAQSLLQPFFPNGWDQDPVPLKNDDERASILNDAGVAFYAEFPTLAWRLFERSLVAYIPQSNLGSLSSPLMNLGTLSHWADRLAEATRLRELTLDIADVLGNQSVLFRARLDLYFSAVTCGNHAVAKQRWREISRMKRSSDRATYRPGDAEYWHALELYQRGRLTDSVLVGAEVEARDGHNHYSIRRLCQLRGEWHLGRGELSHAIESFGHAVQMAREVGHRNTGCEASLNVARLRAGERFEAQAEAERLSKVDSGSLAIAELWHELDQRDCAVKAALLAHERYASEGEPYVNRYYLDRTRALLTKLGVTLPEVPKYDPAKAKIYPWEKDVRAFIDKLKAERKKKEQSTAKPKSGENRKAKRKKARRKA
jgi:hypothetical protein